MSELPDSFRWDKVMGSDFTGDVKNQAHCGSCYDVAFTSMMEARTRIKEAKAVTLSTQFTLQCNWLTEGCHGGWGMLVGYFTNQYYTVSEECAPYKASTVNKSCSEFKHCEPLVKSTKPYLVGGHYGAMTEETLIRELRANGPIMIDFKAGFSFQHYQKGILVEDSKVE